MVEGAVVEWTAMVRREGLPTAVRTEVVLLPVAMPAQTDTHHHHTDLLRDNHTGHHNRALVGMGGVGGRRRRAMVGLKDLREVDRTVGALEADMGLLVILSHTHGVDILVVVVMVAQGRLKEDMVVTAPRTGTVVVHTVATEVVGHTMELQQVGGVVVGNM